MSVLLCYNENIAIWLTVTFVLKLCCTITPTDITMFWHCLQSLLLLFRYRLSLLVGAIRISLSYDYCQM